MYNCYINSIELAIENENRTIAIPLISSGNNKFPIEKSANIAYYASWKMIKKYEEKYLNKIYLSCPNKNTYDIYKNLSQSYKDIEFSIQMIEQYEKMNKYKNSSTSVEDFIKDIGVENCYIVFLLKETFLTGQIGLDYIEETVKVLNKIFIYMKNGTKYFAEKIYPEEIDTAKEILKQIFFLIDDKILDSAKEKTKEYFIHANDYIFEKINNYFEN